MPYRFDRHGLGYRMAGDLHLDAPVEEVFAFLSSPQNMPLLSPPWIGVEVLDTQTSDAGALVDYRMTMYGVPFSWKTLVYRKEAGVHLAYRQLAGPYALWDHTQEFSADGDGTLLKGRIDLAIHGGRVANQVLGKLVIWQVARIFRHRNRVLKRRFPDVPH